MTAKDLKVGETYTAKINNKIQPVRLVSIGKSGSWTDINLNTKREVYGRSARKLRHRVPERTPEEMERAVMRLFSQSSTISTAALSCVLVMTTEQVRTTCNRLVDQSKLQLDRSHVCPRDELWQLPQWPKQWPEQEATSVVD